MADPLAHRIRNDADVGQIADALVDTWRSIDSKLVPLIGQGGVGALFRRSAHLTMHAHPWLAAAQEGTVGAIDLVALKALILRKNAAQARAGGTAMLHSFYALLAGLVGASLTEQLLRSVWQPSAGAPPAQDKLS